ncbi:MAG: hypothetical protein ACXIT4_07885 [Erythrobacter sp.]
MAVQDKLMEPDVQGPRPRPAGGALPPQGRMAGAFEDAELADAELEDIGLEDAGLEEDDPAAEDLAEGPTLTEDIAGLIDSARTYFEAEVGFQKTRAALAGSNIAKAAAALVMALVLVHIAVIALAVGVVMALAPLITIWGAIAVVVGALLLGGALLVGMAARRGKMLAAMFGAGD